MKVGDFFQPWTSPVKITGSQFWRLALKKTIEYFAYNHLPEKLQEVSKPIGELAIRMETTLPDGPEKSAGMSKLLEAKDCFVRAALD